VRPPLPASTLACCDSFWLPEALNDSAPKRHGPAVCYMQRTRAHEVSFGALHQRLMEKSGSSPFWPCFEQPASCRYVQFRQGTPCSCITIKECASTRTNRADFALAVKSGCAEGEDGHPKTGIREPQRRRSASPRFTTYADNGTLAEPM